MDTTYSTKSMYNARTAFDQQGAAGSVYLCKTDHPTSMVHQPWGDNFKYCKIKKYCKSIQRVVKHGHRKTKRS